MAKENYKNTQNTYDDGNIPEIDLPGQNRYGDEPSGQNRYGDEPSGQNRHGDEPSGQNHYGGDATGGYDDSNSNPSGEDHLVWVTPPILLSDTEGLEPNAAGGI